MRTPAELGFLRLSLTQKQAEQWKEFWKKQPTGRYLLPFEVKNYLSIDREIKMPTDAQKDEMGRVWTQFCKQKNLDQGTLPFEHDEWFAWLDYVIAHYKDPLPEPTLDPWAGA